MDADHRALRLEIDDDGVGLDEHNTVGVGLRSMRERAEELGGELRVEGRPREGTRIVASLPLRGRSEEPGTTSRPASMNQTTSEPTVELAPIEAA